VLRSAKESADTFFGKEGVYRFSQWAATCSQFLVCRPVHATLLLHAGGMVDLRTGRVVKNAVVVAEGGRITCAGMVADCPAPIGATRLELGDITLIPGSSTYTRI
jgi:hypothetical protein